MRMVAVWRFIRLMQNRDGNKMANNTQNNTSKNDEMRDFMLVVRQALKMVVAWIERRYIEDVGAKK